VKKSVFWSYFRSLVAPLANWHPSNVSVGEVIIKLLSESPLLHSAEPYTEDHIYVRFARQLQADSDGFEVVILAEEAWEHYVSKMAESEVKTMVDAAGARGD
jgi:hypothetical protein